MSSSAASWGDMVTVARNGRVIGQGVICGGDIFNERIKYVQTGYGDGWHENGDSCFLTRESDTITLLESCWQQKWAKRNRNKEWGRPPGLSRSDCLERGTHG
jgi:hypothetical protein